MANISIPVKYLSYPFILLWRIWFYLVAFVCTLLALPAFLFVLYDDRFYQQFFKVARLWGKAIMAAMGFWSELNAMQAIDPKKSYLFIANHTSMIDVMLMLSIVPNPSVFVGKKELVKIPIFGYVFKKTSITVDRGSAQSRKEVYIESNKRLSKGLSVCIFPEGLVPSDESVVLSEFKNGAFRLAIEHQIPIVPMTFFDCKKRFSYTFFSGSPGRLRVKIHPFIDTAGLDISQLKTLKEQAFHLIHTTLLSDLNAAQKQEWSHGYKKE